MKVVIVAGGNYDENLVKAFIDETEEDVFLIGADRGAFSLINSGYKIDIAIGDFDSVTDEEKETINTYSRKVKKLDPVKDATDMECALKKALDICSYSDDYYNNIYIFAGTGTRLDHTLANINLLYMVMCSSGQRIKENTKAYLIDGHNRIRLLQKKKTYVFYKDQLFGKYISFLPFAGEVNGVKLKGFKYENKLGYFFNGNSLGISNEAVDDMLSVYFENGLLLMIESRD